jgi:tetratricopeptide (TPR) repeat protein
VLDELVAYLQAARDARAKAWALVVSSSEGLAREVLEALAGRLGELEEVDASAGEDPRHIVEAMLAKPHDGFRMSVLLGLTNALGSDDRDELLAWLNFHREDFERPDQAFVFTLSAEHADAWQKLAPDLDRYTQHFDFVDWDDLVADAQRTADEMKMEVIGRREVLQHIDERLDDVRPWSDFAAQTLVDAAHTYMAMGMLQQAKSVLAKAFRLTQGKRNMQRHGVIRAGAILSSHMGRPAEALRGLEQLQEEVTLGALRTDASAERFATGQPLRALDEIRESLASNLDDHLTLSHDFAIVGQWLGRIRASLGHVREAPADLRPWRLPMQAWAWDTLASLLIDTGDVVEALDPLMKSLRVSVAIGFEHARVSSRTSLSRATLDRGHPARCLTILEGATTSPGWKSARSYGLAVVRAEASWVLSGPSGVRPVVRDERKRQRGWRAPIPAAELAYVHALASTHDDQARRRLQDAADRFRAMDGWYYLSELERRLARLDRLEGDLDRATARIQEGLEWHAREGLRPREARDRTEVAMIALGRHDAEAAFESASRALELIHACGTRLYEPATLVALAASERVLGHHDSAAIHDQRWRRLVQGIGAKGLEAALERDAAWARDLTTR